MSDTYTKLFSSITASTIVSEPLATRWLWVTMLAMADASGNVWGSVPGLARIANITLEQCEEALQCFLSPDSYSRTQDHEGRRVEQVDGGWLLLNHGKYRAVRSAEERREYMRNYMAKRREEERKHAEPLTLPLTKLAMSTEVTPPAPTPEKQKHEQQAARFAEFWGIYPCRKGKSEAMKKWKARNLDRIADRIIDDVRKRMKSDRQWTAGYIPHGSTYVNKSGWEDEIEPIRNGSEGTDDFMRGAI